MKYLIEHFTLEAILIIVRDALAQIRWQLAKDHVVFHWRVLLGIQPLRGIVRLDDWCGVADENGETNGAHYHQKHCRKHVGQYLGRELAISNAQHLWHGSEEAPSIFQSWIVSLVISVLTHIARAISYPHDANHAFAPNNRPDSSLTLAPWIGYMPTSARTILDRIVRRTCERASTPNHRANWTFRPFDAYNARCDWCEVGATIETVWQGENSGRPWSIGGNLLSSL